MPMTVPSGGFGEYLTVGEAADFLGVSPWTLRNWDKAGKLKPRRHPKNGYRIYRHEDLQAVLEADGSGRSPDRLLTPQIDWSQMGKTEHFVQFYESDDFLADSVAGFAAAAINSGDAAVMISTQAHRDGIRGRLESRQLDIDVAIADGRFIELDAEETLSKFMVDGLPDPLRFAQFIGPIITRLSKNGRRVCAFGEMVALLWAGGHQAAAIRLEALWNDLAKSHSFALFCAYPIRDFGRESDGKSFRDICTCHTRVIPAESYAAISLPEERLRAITRLQQKAQSLQAEIVHRTEVEKALSRQQRELSDFVENALEGLHKVGPDGRILWANRAELQLLGYRAEEYVGHHINEFHVDREVIDDMLARLHRGEKIYDRPARLRCKDGSIKHVLTHSNGYFEDGQFVYSRCFTRDVTAARKAEDRQLQILESERAARAEAERVSRMKDEFLATLSHELRTPLNAIFGWTQIIRQSPSKPEVVAEGIAVINRNVRAQTQLIQDLLDMSRIISGKVRLDIKQTDLSPVLDAAYAAVRPAADAKGIQIRKVIDPLAGPVMADADRIQQVVWNLLTNAVKFSPIAGKIDLLLERVNSHLEITVSDSGEGISPQFLPHVFERFRQADSSAARKHSGLGLGLSIVKQLVELHGGTVCAKSAGLGNGATFVVALPLAASKQSESIQSSPASIDIPGIDCSGIRLKGIKVLVVDDEADARELIGRLLRESDAEVIMAESTDEAVALLKSERPHVLVSDIGLPGKDGYQLIREIRALPAADGSGIPAIALTAFARSEDRKRAMRSGYQVHVSKPIESQELIVTIASLMARAQHS
jgi:PAS domain S-box-containing protein